MLTQIYEIAPPAEAEAISAISVDHIGVLVNDGTFLPWRCSWQEDSASRIEHEISNNHFAF